MKSLLVCLVLCFLITVSSATNKQKRGIFHGLHHGLHHHQPRGLHHHHHTLPGYSLGYNPFAYHAHHAHHAPKHHHHAGPYSRFPGVIRTVGGGGFVLAPGGAQVTSYSSTFPKFQGVLPYASKAAWPFPLASRPFASLGPITSLAPVPSAFPVATPHSTSSSFFATFPQKSFIPVAAPFPIFKPKVPQFAPIIPNGLFPASTSPLHPSLAAAPLQPQFLSVGVPSLAPPTVATVNSIPANDPWKPLFVSQPTPLVPTPTTVTAFKPAQNLLPPYGVPTNSQPGSFFISSTAAPTNAQDPQQAQEQQFHQLHEQHEQEQHQLHQLQQQHEHEQHIHQLHQALHQAQEEAQQAQQAQQAQSQQSAFNGQPYDVASNHGRYIGPSSYDVDINQGYQK